MNILALFWILEKLSDFPHWLWCLLWIFPIWHLLYWSMLLLYLFFWEFLSWKNVEFCQMFFLHLIQKMELCGFCLSLCWWNMSYWLFICWTSFHPRDKSHLVMVYDLYSVLLNWFASILLRVFANTFCRDVGLFSCGFSFVLCCLFWLWNQSDAGLIKWVWKGSPFLYFLKTLRRVCVSSLNVS